MGRDWYILKVKTLRERRATGELRRMGFRVYVPQRTTTGRRGARRRPLMCGYLFVRFPTKFIDLARRPMFGILRENTRLDALVLDWLRWTAKDGERSPVPISDASVRSLTRRRMNHEFDDEATIRALREAQWAELKDAMKAGSPVRIIDGAFAAFTAIIESLDDKKGAWVRVNGLGRETRIHMDQPSQQLAPLDNEREAA